MDIKLIIKFHLVKTFVANSSFYLNQIPVKLKTRKINRQLLELKNKISFFFFKLQKKILKNKKTEFFSFMMKFKEFQI